MHNVQAEAAERVAGLFAEDNETSLMQRTQNLKLECAHTTLVFHFTPRSGSSWLSSILESTGILGTGLELFNPDFMADIARAYGARSLAEYIQMARHVSGHSGVLSLEVTSHQLSAAFKNPSEFFRIYENCPSYFLIREDIVSQAVSLTKMVKTGVSHAPQINQDDLNSADETFEYSADEILSWLNHILEAERNSEKFFEDYGVQPLRISYERMFSKDVDQFLSDITEFAGLPQLPETVKAQSDHKMLATKINRDFAKRFTYEHEHYLNEVNAERRTRLEKLAW